MIPLVKVALPSRELLIPALEKVLYSGMIAEGEAVYEFEKEFATHFGLNNIVAMSSGTAALHAALSLGGITAGDEVISTAMTAEPTNLAILHCGATVVWADVDPANGNICPNSVKNQITSKTKAIICVHYAGYPARLRELRQIADSNNILLIEDCAHALGASYESSPIGSFGDFSIFSFQAIKHMTTVDGGALVVKNQETTEAAKKFRWFGMLKGVPRTEIDVSSVGYKYNMHNVAATIGLCQLKEIDNLISRHIENGNYFDSQFSAISGIRPARVERFATPSYWIYTLQADEPDNLIKSLSEIRVTASKLHKPNNLHSIFKNQKRELPCLNEFYRNLVHIPCGWWVTDEQREEIVDILKRG